VDAACRPIRLLGVNRAGTESQCVQTSAAIFDGPVDAAALQAISAWHVNAVRIPLNEDCWLGINGVNPASSGAVYVQAILDYVGRLNQAGLLAVLDLHWSAPGTVLATGQQPMADADHSPEFWYSVATAFRKVPGVVFDLFNEPHLDGLSGSAAWQCWRWGCSYGGWQTAGMEELILAVRAAGAMQPVLVAGLIYSNDLSGWLANEPWDPGSPGLGPQIVANVHMFWNSNTGAQCVTPATPSSSCALSVQQNFWDADVAPVAGSVPVVTGEFGEYDCGRQYVDVYTSWADAHGVSYLGWAWNTQACGPFPALISDYGGTPTLYGAGLCDHLAALAQAAIPAACQGIGRRR
jgi:hypothetical protein